MYQIFGLNKLESVGQGFSKVVLTGIKNNNLIF